MVVKEQKPAIPLRANRSFGRWVSDHLDSSLDSLGRFVRAPVQSLLTLLVIAVALSLPALLYMLVDSVEAGISDVRQSADISVYFFPGTPEGASMLVQSQVLAMPGIQTARYLPPEKALEEFQEFSGLGDALGYLDDNPLPATLLVTPEGGREDIENILSQIEAMESVDQVQFDFMWLQRLEALLSIVERIVFLLAAIIGAGVILILGNTIRLEIESRREEVLVVKLVGGTDAYVRRPLLYTGIWFGVVGALLAWFITNFFAVLMSGPLGSLGELYLQDFEISGLDLFHLLVMLITGFCLGIFGAWIAAARHLAAIEPK